MDEQIAGLSDAEAVRLVQVIARAERDGGEELPAAVLPELRAALRAAFEVDDEGDQDVSEGELAREMLRLLAREPGRREAVAALVAHAPPPRFDLGGTVALTTAVLLVLQTHVRFERTPEGRWSVLVEKKPTSDELLGPLVRKLIAFLPGE